MRILSAEPIIATRNARARATVLAVPFVLAALHMAVFDRGLGGDGWATFAFLESAVEDGDLHLENNTRGVTNGLLPGRGGHLVMQYPPGVAILDLAPYLAGRGLDRLLPHRWLASEAAVPPVGPVPRRVFLEIAAIVVARNLEVLAGLLAILLALRRVGFADGVAAAATALAFFGGPLVFYSLVGASHAPTFALAALLLLVLTRHGDASARRVLLAGLLVGAATLVRYSAVALLPAVLLGTWTPRPWRRWSAALAGVAMPLLLLPPYWRLHYGQWNPIGYGGSLHPTFASPWNVLCAGHHGLFLFHPALLLAVTGLVLGWLAKVRPGGVPLYRLAAVWFVSVALLHGWWSEWANVGGYGQRFLIDALPALAIGFAGVLVAGRWRALVVPALALTVLFGYLLFFTAVAGLVRNPAGAPWPQTLADYEPLVRRPPSLTAVGRGLLHASFALRTLAGGQPDRRDHDSASAR
jgi:hypothetical protein